MINIGNFNFESTEKKNQLLEKCIHSPFTLNLINWQLYIHCSTMIILTLIVTISQRFSKSIYFNKRF